MYIQLITYGIVASMILMGGAWAQTAALNADSETPTGDSGAAAVTGLFDGLSPGNRMIAKSLFDAQQIDDGDSALTLDHIALSKQDGTGWGNIFKQMKEEGLVPEKNLGQAVSGQGRTGSIAGGPAWTARLALTFMDLAVAAPARAPEYLARDRDRRPGFLRPTAT